jgi:hypothetical protein
VGDAADPVRDGEGEGDGVAVRAPGTLEAHYAPEAEVLLVELGHASATDLVPLAVRRAARVARQSAERRFGQPERDPFGLTTPEGSDPAPIMRTGSPASPSMGLVAPSAVATPDGWTRLVAPVTAEEYARLLYAALRHADELGLDAVVAVLPDADAGPLALAVRDRLARAAHASG